MLLCLSVIKSVWNLPLSSNQLIQLISILQETVLTKGVFDNGSAYFEINENMALHMYWLTQMSVFSG